MQLAAPDNLPRDSAAGEEAAVQAGATVREGLANAR
jgi:hypothetical protein